MKKNKEEKDPVDVNNDGQMVALGLRNPKAFERDPSVWSKTDEERKSLSYFKSMFDFNSSKWAAPQYKVGTPDKLIVYLKGFKRVEKAAFQKQQPRTTMSHTCVRSEIKDILASYKKQGLQIVKYVWQGKTYGPDEVPVRLRRNLTVQK